MPKHRMKPLAGAPAAPVTIAADQLECFVLTAIELTLVAGGGAGGGTTTSGAVMRSAISGRSAD